MQPTASLSEQAYLQLRQDILTCVLLPGQVVTERELGRQYAMSKTPVREALTQASHAGLVQRLPGKGYLVTPVTINDVLDLYDLRLILELAAAQRAAENPSPSQVAALRELAVAGYNIDDSESHILFLDANRRFHLTLAEAAHNRRLVATLEGLLSEMDRLFHLGLRVRDSSDEMKREHEEVVVGLEQGDVKRVRDAVSQQILASRDRVLEGILRGVVQNVQVGA